jgi:hypothetical protein
MRELFRSILSANLTLTGVLLVAAALIIFIGAFYLLLYTNLGTRLAFLITGVSLFGWITINSLLFVLYAPRGPRPLDIEGLNSFEIRIIPMAYMLASGILFLMFLTALSRFESAQEAG